MTEGGERCEYCGDSVDETSVCGNCSANVHTRCMDFLDDHGAVCPHCYESLIDAEEMAEETTE